MTCVKSTDRTHQYCLALCNLRTVLWTAWWSIAVRTSAFVIKRLPPSLSTSLCVFRRLNIVKIWTKKRFLFLRNRETSRVISHARFKGVFSLFDGGFFLHEKDVCAWSLIGCAHFSIFRTDMSKNWQSLYQHLDAILLSRCFWTGKFLLPQETYFEWYQRDNTWVLSQLHQLQWNLQVDRSRFIQLFLCVSEIFWRRVTLKNISLKMTKRCYSNLPTA